jgi:hypothetical protein
MRTCFLDSFDAANLETPQRKMGNMWVYSTQYEASPASFSICGHMKGVFCCSVFASSLFCEYI